MSKYLIAIVFLLGLTQGKSEALDLDAMVMIKEVAAVSNKYEKCTRIKGDKKKLTCFDGLTNYIKEKKNTTTFLVKTKGEDIN